MRTAPAPISRVNASPARCASGRTSGTVSRAAPVPVRVSRWRGCGSSRSRLASMPRSVAQASRMGHAAHMRHFAPGFELYTVRSLLARDFEGTLEALARIGYREVEGSDLFGRTPAEV